MSKSEVEEYMAEHGPKKRNRKPAVVKEQCTIEQRKEAMQLIALGVSQVKVAEKFGVSRKTIYNWLQNEDMMAEVTQSLKREVVGLVAKAIAKLNTLMDSNKEWLQIQSCQTVLSNFKTDVMGSADRDVVVHIDNMPEMGMPISEEKQKEQEMLVQ